MLLVAGIGLAATRAGRRRLVVAGYVVLTSLYSAVLKHVAVVDLVAVAAGFVLRAIAGAVATDVPMSKWFVLTTSFASLFIVTGKRYAELRELGDNAQTRATLDDYSLGYLRIVLSVSCGAALVTLLHLGVRHAGDRRARRGRSTSCRSCRWRRRCCATC